MLSNYRYDTLKKGSHIAILGAVHGDEHCGTEAIKKLIAEIEQGDLILQQGVLTCIPVCNPEAYKRNTRFYQRNLNRSLYIKEKPTLYEDFIDPAICRVLDDADVLLDLHSYASQGSAFGFLGNSSQAEIDYCLSLGIKDFVYGWSEAFSKATQDPKESMGTTEYARSVGCIATTIECGHHHNQDAADIAYKTIKNALSYLGIIDRNGNKNEIKDHSFAKMETVFFKEKEGKATRDWKHYDEVNKGDILAEYSDGETILAPEDGYIILPKMHAEIGGEWFYFGVKTQCPSPIAVT